MNRLAELLARWDAGQLSPADQEELKQLLGSPEARAELVEDWRLTETIFDSFHTQATTVPAAAPSRVVPRSAALGARPVSARRFRWVVWREIHLTLGRAFAFGAAACLAFAGLWFYFQKATVASLSEARSGVMVSRRGQTLPATAGQPLYAGDAVIVSATGAATVVWPGESSALLLAAGAKLELSNPMFGKRLALHTGALEASVAPQSHFRPMTLLTPQAEARVVGTRFFLTATNAATRLEVLQGAVRLRKTHPTASDPQAEVLVHAGHAATASAAVPLGIDWLTGFLSSDAWTAPTGVPLSDAPTLGVPLPEPAAVIPPAAGSNIVERLRGYLLAPATGEFVFWIASHRGGAPVELWFSPDANPAHKRRIAFETPAAVSGAGPGNSSLQLDFQRAATQQSPAQPLEQGRRYYLEIWHAGADLRSLGLGWRLPGQPVTDQPAMVDLKALCPFIETVAEATRK